MAHLICVGHTKQEMREILSMYRDAGLQNIMALGGDISDDPTLVASEFTHAIELVELAKEVGDFSVGVAAHPLGHPRSTSMEEDRRFLAEKLAIADFAVTQFFFSAQEWEALVRDLADLGCTKPIVPGIMPVTTLSGAQRMAAMGAAVPESLMADLESCADASAVRALGIQRATELCRDLLEAGAPGLHFYTLNRSTATRDMCAALQA
jgi:methylenetetrahydrofolate reductase (NADPH)